MGKVTEEKETFLSTWSWTNASNDDDDDNDDDDHDAADDGADRSIDNLSIYLYLSCCELMMLVYLASGLISGAGTLRWLRCPLLALLQMKDLGSMIGRSVLWGLQSPGYP